MIVHKTTDVRAARVIDPPKVTKSTESQNCTAKHQWALTPRCRFSSTVVFWNPRSLHQGERQHGHNLQESAATVIEDVCVQAVRYSGIEKALLDK